MSEFFSTDSDISSDYTFPFTFPTISILENDQNDFFLNPSSYYELDYIPDSPIGIDLDSILTYIDSPYYTENELTGGSLYEKIFEKNQKNQKFQIEQKSIHYKSNPMIHTTFDEFIDLARDFFEAVFESEIVPFQNTRNLLRLVILHPNFDYPISFPFMLADDWTVDIIWERFEKCMQSKKNKGLLEYPLYEKLEIHITVCDPVRGGSRKRKTTPEVVDISQIKKYRNVSNQDVMNYEEFVKKKRCIIQFNNNDKLCLIRAILISKELIDSGVNLTNKDYKYLLDKKTIDLANHFSIPMDFECGIQEVKKIEDFFVEYQIMIFHVNIRIFTEPIWQLFFSLVLFWEIFGQLKKSRLLLYRYNQIYI